MVNLWEETLSELSKHGKTFDEVLFIQGKDFKITKDNFETVAKKTDYYGGYGSQRVATDIMLVGGGWWLERGEYDGMEWWEYKSIPIEIDKVEYISQLANGMWDTLKDLNEVVL